MFKIQDKKNCHHGQWPQGDTIFRLTTLDSMAGGIRFDASFHYKKTSTDQQQTLGSDTVQENAEGVGDFGGTCACPNGQSYEVGDVISKRTRGLRGQELAPPW